MRTNTTMPRPILGVMLCGLLLAACCVGAAKPVAAMGGFGRTGGFG